MKRPVKVQALTGTILAGLLAAYQGVAFGQTADPAAEPSQPNATSEIIVTARRRLEALSDVPLTVVALNEAQLKNSGVTQVSDLSRVVPSFSATRNYTGAPIFTLRGIGLNDVTLGALPSVAVYVDESPMAFSSMAQGVAFDLERVEVLKGPQGLLFGQSSTAGAINFIANKPSDSFGAGLNLSYGRFGTAYGEAFITGGIANNISARLSVTGERAGPWQRSYTRDDEIGRVRRGAGRAQLSWTPSPDLKVLININGWIDKSDPQIPQFLAPTNVSGASSAILNYPVPPRSNRAADWDPDLSDPALHHQPSENRYRRDDNMIQGSARVEWDFSQRATLTLLTSIARMKAFQISDVDGTAIHNVDYSIKGRLDSFTQEIRLGGDLSNLTYTLGALYSNDRAKERYEGSFDDISYNRVLGPDFLFFGNVVSARQKHETWAGFGNVDYDVMSTITLSAGVRYTHIKHILKDACQSDPGGRIPVWPAFSR